MLRVYPIKLSHSRDVILLATCEGIRTSYLCKQFQPQRNEGSERPVNHCTEQFQVQYFYSSARLYAAHGPREALQQSILLFIIVVNCRMCHRFAASKKIMGFISGSLLISR
jgi:hypothetical protein